jgi:hypothetical protein
VEERSNLVFEAGKEKRKEKRKKIELAIAKELE